MSIRTTARFNMERRIPRIAVGRYIAIVCIVAGFSTSAQAVSPRGAFLRSLVLPGWGQHALGADSRAAVFLSVEGATWAGIAGLAFMRDIYTDDYRSLAVSVAGANVVGKPRTYFDDLAFYDTRLLHNQAANVLEQPDPELYGVEDDWQWPDADARQRFRSRYNDAKQMRRNIDYALLVVTLNHLASAIDAGKLAGRIAKAEPSGVDRHRNPVSLGFVAIPDGGVKAVWGLRF
jgi:hypothetical protein